MNTPAPTPPLKPIELVLITGMSGSGKSIALTALEDLGYYCVDNLPPELLASFIALEQSHRASKVAIAMDVRSAASLPGLPARLAEIRHQPGQDVHLTTVFLDATTDTLVRRFSETRRRHPLSLKPSNDEHRALTDAIEYERELLSELRDMHEAVNGDETELFSAVWNLVSNALRYTPQGGQVRVAFVRREDGSAEFSVADSGVGIAKEHIPRLTERFYRIDSSRSRETGGTGLGLAIVKHVVQRHGGTLQVDSTPGKGSTFRILLPAQRVRAPLPAHAVLPANTLP